MKKKGVKNAQQNEMQEIYQLLREKGWVNPSDAEIADALPQRGRDKPLSIIIRRALNAIPPNQK